jgi:hypothetical protein
MLRLEVIISCVRTGIIYSSKGLSVSMAYHIWCYFLEVVQRFVLKTKTLGFGHMSEAKIMLIPYPLDSIGTAVSWNSEQSPKTKTMSKFFK